MLLPDIRYPASRISDIKEGRISSRISSWPDIRYNPNPYSLLPAQIQYTTGTDTVGEYFILYTVT